MPAFCAALNCNDKYGHSKSISFHKFPLKRKDLLQQWLQFTERGSAWQPSQWSAICSRHFRDEDFNCSQERRTLKKTAVPSVRQCKAVDRAAAATEDVVADEKQPKFNCRLCGCASVSGVPSYAENYEIYGMLQKCFPTLNIQQNDSLPKGVCPSCLERLESFAQFFDQVEAQCELRKFRSDKGSVGSATGGSGRTTERQQQLKIKQEPVVRVKQEVAEGFDSFLSDELDCVDEGEPTGTASGTDVDQKYQLCDFPMLNTQDIINNCDIMEIINLEDPFIDIPDDDGNNASNAEPFKQLPQQQQQHLPSAYDLLQTHLLNEEHNYAYSPEDFKEDWLLKHAYKTEKTDDCDDEPDGEEHIYEPLPATTTAANDKPIVTSVAAAFVSKAATKPKPNIVVLNESIVQSASSDFQLHACTHCPLKFFSAESLAQHRVSVMPTAPLAMCAPPQPPPPMVSVPSGNLLSAPAYAEPMQQQHCKQEFGYEAQPQPPDPPLSFPPQRINILEMQQTFLPPQQQQCNYDLADGASSGQQQRRRSKRTLETISAYCDRLQQRYRQLRQKYRTLEQAGGKAAAHKQRRRFACIRCGQHFQRITQLLRHKQAQAATHHIRQPATRFAGSCAGCERFFRSKLALRNHMRYICQTLPLRCYLRAQMTFKCRYCRRITFTHWRLCRRHEIKCRAKQSRTERSKRRRRKAPPRGAVKQQPTAVPAPPPVSPKKAIRQPTAAARLRRGDYACCKCDKVFASSNSLHQHGITHTDARKHECLQCGRKFKRRNGLVQHVSGFHMQLKPFECAVCLRRYALKCDMQRCRHSQLRRTTTTTTTCAAAPTTL